MLISYKNGTLESMTQRTQGLLRFLINRFLESRKINRPPSTAISRWILLRLPNEVLGTETAGVANQPP